MTTILSPVPYNAIENEDFIGKTTILLEASKFEHVDYQDGKLAITYSNCRFSTLQIENQEDIEFKDVSISFLNCYIGDIKITEITSTNISLHFSSSIISGNINNSNINYVGVNNCIIDSTIFFQNINKLDISYTEENIFARRWIRLFKSVNTTFERILLKKNSFFINDCKELTFRFNENNEDDKTGLKLSNKHTIGEKSLQYYLTKEDKKKLNINLSLSSSAANGHRISKIHNSILNSLTIKGNFEGEIQVENSSINNFYLHNFSTDKSAIFFDIKPRTISNNVNTKLELHKSNLDNVIFDNFSLAKYTEISLYRNKFGQSTSFISCDFPNNFAEFEKIKTIENIHYPEKKDDNYYKNRYEVFLQLKKIVENSGNFYESQKLQMVSNEALKQVESIPAQDKFILWVNSFSNNHGLSIGRPFIWLIIVSIIFYICYLWTLDKIFICSSIDWNLIGYYFSFLDITHRTDFLVNKNELSGLSLFIDYFNKIITGFFIYQFVASFRKYGKK